MRSADVTRTTKTPIKETYQSYFTPTDESIPYRLVGSYEYVRALEAFTDLLAKSTTEEIAIYDKVLNERHEFSFFNGVFLSFQQQPDLVKANDIERRKFDDKFKKRGLAWMMALARIELAATSSLYGKVDYPFEALVDGDIDVKPYVEILHDDVVAHMKSLAAEPSFKEVLRRARKPDTWTLAYLRRIKLIRDMLKTLERIGGEQVSTEIEPYVYELKKHERNLVDQVLSVTESSSTSSVDSTSTQRRESRTTSITAGRCRNFVRDNFSTGSSPAGGSPASYPPSTGGNRTLGSQ